MKRILLFIIFISITLTTVSCDFLNQTTSEDTQATVAVTTIEQITTLDSIEETTVTTAVPTTEITTEITTETTTEVVTTETTTQVTTITSAQTTATTTADPNTPIVPVDLNLIQDEMYYVGIPTEGDVKVLVFVVEFDNDPTFSSGITLNDIDIAFNGSDTQLDYESLNSYYLKSSYGKLNLTADIFGFYTPDDPLSYYESEYETGYPDSDLILELLEAYDSIIDYSDYDANDDGFIDGIYIIYDHPVSYSYGSDLWWAYQGIFMYEDYSFDGVEPVFYTWAGADFFFEGSDDINARTIIHETGHMLGLDDYYDYYEYDSYDNSDGLGGADMMDSTYGDHNPFSKMILGWITPMVVDSSMTVDIIPFLENGDVILLIDEWNDTLFDEYILISYYTPLGLNEADKYNIFSIYGIVMYHVSAQIDDGYNSDYYYTIFNNNNTDSEHMLIKFIEADMDLETNIGNDDLFLVDDVLGGNIYPTYRWYDDTFLRIQVDIIFMDNDKATIDIRF